MLGLALGLRGYSLSKRLLRMHSFRLVQAASPALPCLAKGVILRVRYEPFHKFQKSNVSHCATQLALITSTSCKFTFLSLKFP